MSDPLNRLTRLVLVDDDPSMVRLLTKIIRQSFSEGVEITSFTDPEEAKEWIETKIVDVLITDLEMPGVDGLELLRCAKQRNAFTQVLFITGNSSLGALTDALEFGATDYLLKPIDQEELVEFIRHVQQRQRRWAVALAKTIASQTASAR
ncbi:MAG: response regulator [Candidatus Nealsonbacteria bacterium]|nr:response regulator [Candidatus Nealsonbacteria bacterium]